jgi:hypothetical protein
MKTKLEEFCEEKAGCCIKGYVSVKCYESFSDMGKDTKAKPAAKGGEKSGKGAAKEDKKSEGASKEAKGGSSVNVRHILCEKQSK